MSSQTSAISSLDSHILDRNCDFLGLSTTQLMENAGRAVADEVTARFGKGTIVVVFGGTGRNGGDGMVAARHLANHGFKVTYLLVGDERDIGHESVAKNWRILKSMSASITTLEVADSAEFPDVRCEIAVDAMLGTGAKGSLRQPITRAVEVFNRLKCFKVSVDVPTGIDADTGAVRGSAVKSDLTVTLHAEKQGFAKARQHCGEVKVADIGIPAEAQLYAGPGDVEAAIVKRSPDAHKGQFGRLLVIGGSETYSGAPALVALAALRSGVDLVFVAAPEACAHDIASFSPNLITIKLKGGHLAKSQLNAIRDQIERATAVAIGPGLGVSSETKPAVRQLQALLHTLKKPVVIDADALRALAPIKSKFGLPAVLTPHAGEYEAVSGKKLSRDLQARADEVEAFAGRVNAVVVLKGRVDVISDGARTKLNWTGNPAMTVGGTGDVLTGIVSGLMAQGVQPFRAAVAAAFVNGVAGDLAAKEYGNHIVPTDLIPLIHTVFNDPMIAARR